MKEKASVLKSSKKYNNDEAMYEGGRENTLIKKGGALSETSSQKAQAKERVFYADWIRALAIILVILVHTLCNSFDASGLDPQEVPTIQQKKDGIIKCLVQIGIPMFFYISGIGATFFRTEDKNFGIFVGEKTLRLLVPFVIGIFAFLIPRLYFGQQYEDFTRPNDEIETNYWQFMQKTLPSIHLKLSWLWYLPALFIDFMLTYPLLRWSIRRSKRIPYDPLIDTGIIAHQMITLAIWGCVCYFLVTKDYYGRDYLIPALGVLSMAMVCFYSFQLIIPYESGYHYAIWIKFLGPLASICLNNYKTQTPNQNLYHIFLMIMYDAIFFSQGVVDMCYWRKMLRKRKEIGNTSLAPICVGIAIFLYALTCPMNYSEMGHLFFYPLYGNYTLQCLYTTGTWLWVFTIVWIMALIGNDKFHDTVYKYMTGASLYAYLSHYFFIIIISVSLVRPYKIKFIPAFFLMFFGTFFLIFITYWPLNALYELVVPPKEMKKADLTPDGELTEEQQAAAAAAAKAAAIEKGEAQQDEENLNADKISGLSENIKNNNKME